MANLSHENHFHLRTNFCVSIYRKKKSKVTLSSEGCQTSTASDIKKYNKLLKTTHSHLYQQIVLNYQLCIWKHMIFVFVIYIYEDVINLTIDFVLTYLKYDKKASFDPKYPLNLTANSLRYYSLNTYPKRKKNNGKLLELTDILN